MSKGKNQRIAIFIDHSNVYHYVRDRFRIDPLWNKYYNPLRLGEKLCGNRQLVGVNFYCSPPPSWRLSGSESDKNSYWSQISYYEEVKKLSNVTVKYGRLTGIRGDMHEKDVDTQLCTDLIVKATNNEYDTAIIAANDGDYVSPVKAISAMGRKIELLYFKGDLPWELRSVCSIVRRARRVYFENLPFTMVNGNP